MVTVEGEVTAVGVTRPRRVTVMGFTAECTELLYKGVHLKPKLVFHLTKEHRATQKMDLKN